MKCKDKADTRSKEGCGRVFAFQEFNIIHSYTLECGYHYPSKTNKIANLAKCYPNDQFHHTIEEDYTSKIYEEGAPYFTT